MFGVKGLRAGILAFAVMAIVQPAFAQGKPKKEPPPRPPLDIRPALKDDKPVKAAKAKPKVAPKAADTVTASAPAAPTGPTLASASSTPVTLPSANPASAVTPMPDLKPSIPPKVETAFVPVHEPTLRGRFTRNEIERMRTARASLDPMIAKHAKLNDVPETLVHRVVMRETKYQPKLVGRCGCYGLMQIKPGTARRMGYTGAADGLLDAETNLTYAVKYLAGAYRKAGGNHDRAVALYARGY